MVTILRFDDHAAVNQVAVREEKNNKEIYGTPLNHCAGGSDGSFCLGLPMSTLNCYDRRQMKTFRGDIPARVNGQVLVDEGVTFDAVDELMSL